MSLSSGSSPVTESILNLLRVWYRLALAPITTAAVVGTRPVTDSGGQLLTGELLVAFLRHTLTTAAHQSKLGTTLSLYLENVTCAVLGGGGAGSRQPGSL